jgi:hypothetical protein
MSLSALLERVEGATGPDRALDEAISLALCVDHYFAQLADAPEGVGFEAYKFHGYADSSALRVTASVDAALALIGRVLPGVDPKIWRWRGQWGASLHDPENGSMVIAQHHYSPTPALALCAALLAAMIGEEAKPSPPSTVTP